MDGWMDGWADGQTDRTGLSTSCMLMHDKHSNFLVTYLIMACL